MQRTLALTPFLTTERWTMKKHKQSPGFGLSNLRAQLLVESSKAAGVDLYVRLRSSTTVPVNTEVYQKIGFHVYHQLVIYRGRDYDD